MKNIGQTEVFHLLRVHKKKCSEYEAKIVMLLVINSHKRMVEKKKCKQSPHRNQFEWWMCENRMVFISIKHKVCCHFWTFAMKWMRDMFVFGDCLYFLSSHWFPNWIELFSSMSIFPHVKHFERDWRVNCWKEWEIRRKKSNGSTRISLRILFASRTSTRKQKKRGNNGIEKRWNTLAAIDAKSSWQRAWPNAFYMSKSIVRQTTQMIW